MFEDDSDSVTQLGKKIYEAIYRDDDNADLNPDDILTALAHTIIFQMSLVCPACRKNIAAKIRRELPAWVNYAGQLAASSQHPTGACH
jgi:hypothetical protein